MCYKKIFIIGNGFDLNFKLPTSTDNYKECLESFTIEGRSNCLNASDFFSTYIENYWSNTEQLLANLDLISLSEDNIVPPDYLSDHESDRDGGIVLMEQLSDDVISARDEALALMVSKADLTHIDTSTINEKAFDDALIINFNYTTTLERLYTLNKSSILHIHGCLEDGDYLIFGFKEDESYNPEEDFVTNAVLNNRLNEEIKEIESNRLLSKAEKDEQIETLRYNYESEFNDYYINEQEITLANLYNLNKKEFQFDKLESFLNGHIGKNSKIEEVVVLGHSLNDVDSEYFELIERRVKPRCWTISQYKKHPCLAELKKYSFSNKKQFCSIDEIL